MSNIQTTIPSAVMPVGKTGKLVSFERAILLGNKSQREQMQAMIYLGQCKAGTYGNFIRDCIEVLCNKSQRELALAMLGPNRHPNKETAISALRAIIGLNAGKVLKGEKARFNSLAVALLKSLDTESVSVNESNTVEMV